MPMVRDAQIESTTREDRSLEGLYAQHIEWATGLAYLLTRDPHLAEDLAQEGFVRVAARLHHLRHPEAFRSYLRRTIANLANSHFRRVWTERRVSEDVVGEPGALDSPEPLDASIAAHVASLPPRQRAAVVLRYYEDLSEGDVADALGCSKRAVNALVSRAMETLRRRIVRSEQ